jgi:methionine-rich copper-binding protein CopC
LTPLLIGRLSMSRLLTRCTVVTIALLVVVGLSGGPAAAHSGLEASVPTDGEVVTVAPEAITLTFTDAVRAQFAQVAVTGPDGQSIDSGAVALDGQVVRQRVRVGAAGPHVIAYRIVAADGHPVGGQVSFTYNETVGDAASSLAGSTGPTSAAVAPGSEDSRSDSEGSGSFLAMEVAVTAAAMGVQVLVVLLLVRRERNGR